MINTSILVILFIGFFASVTFNGFFRNIAKVNNILIDIPDKSRKFHFRATPLTGGISIYVATLVSAILLSGLTNIPVETNFSDRGLIKDLDVYETSISRNYTVDNKSYELEINQNNANDSISVNLNMLNGNQSIEVSKMDDGSFEVTLPDGSIEIYNYQNGVVSKVSENQILIPKLNKLPSIKVDTVTLSMLICGALIIVIMTIDDLYSIRASLRLFFQSIIAVTMIVLSGETISNLGNLLGDGDIIISKPLSIIFTVFCTVGIMNAFNMSDGLNGICASFGLIPLIFIGFSGPVHYGTIILMGVLMGFLSYNLGWLGKKRRAFLGDSGSNSIGFAVAVLCIYYSQGYSASGYTINPVTSLWLVAIPLLDCLGVITSRAIKGVMPFRPGRDHFHHKLLDLGFSPKQILLIFVFLSIALCSIGFILESIYADKEYISFGLFIIFSIIFYAFTRRKISYV
ncbi:undecaprenyl/decaprenyl-phosphate alpha-N-acetylglucosaminyl 1-phosphate transferase [Gammaproteobacteria bacterium]|nr:undecaprenyl/decaprenyl-phosphate alpha-N-acetylglucosaminyl 1-phosphate transferase [Gammaproteobacteria bacterium]